MLAPATSPARKLAAETADDHRFRSRAAFVRHKGSAPTLVWFGNIIRHRLRLSRNRQLNVALQRTAITQLHQHAERRTYLEHPPVPGTRRPRQFGLFVAVPATMCFDR